MKVYIGKYRDHWISPYTILEKVFFWKDWAKEDGPLYPKSVDKISDKLVPISNGIQWVLDKVHPRVKYVKIDKWDTWNMDSTLAPIILPMLKQLKENKHGSPMVDIEDVPEHMRTTSTEEYDSQSTFDFYHEYEVEEGWVDIHTRWNWVMDEMIFAFESYTYDWEEKYRSGVHDIQWEPAEDRNMSRMIRGPNDTYQCDYAGLEKEQNRIDNGLRLFGRYYRGLWD
jgi:hypothetical protein